MLQRAAETDLGKKALTLPAPLAKAPFKARVAAPLYFSLPATTKTLPLWYLLLFLLGLGQSKADKSEKEIRRGWLLGKSDKIFLGIPISTLSKSPTKSIAES